MNNSITQRELAKRLGITFLKSGWYTTPAEYARLHNLTRQAIYKRLQRGQLFSHRIGGTQLIWMPGKTSVGVIANIKPKVRRGNNV